MYAKRYNVFVSSVAGDTQLILVKAHDLIIPGFEDMRFFCYRPIIRYYPTVVHYKDGWEIVEHSSGRRLHVCYDRKSKLNVVKQALTKLADRNITPVKLRKIINRLVKINGVANR